MLKCCSGSVRSAAMLSRRKNVEVVVVQIGVGILNLKTNRECLSQIKASTEDSSTPVQAMVV